MRIPLRRLLLILLCAAMAALAVGAGRAMAETDPATVTLAQEVLSTRGYDAGPADGRIGPQTVAAIRDFQAANDLPETGRLDDATLAALGVPLPRQGGRPPALPVAPVAIETLPDDPADAPLQSVVPEVADAGEGEDPAAEPVPAAPVVTAPARDPPISPRAVAPAPAAPAPAAPAPAAITETESAPVRPGSPAPETTAGVVPDGPGLTEIAAATPPSESETGRLAEQALAVLRNYWWALIMVGMTGFAMILVHR